MLIDIEEREREKMFVIQNHYRDRVELSIKHLNALKNIIIFRQKKKLIHSDWAIFIELHFIAFWKYTHKKRILSLLE